MAKRRSNRAVRRLFAHKTKVSNRRRAFNYHRFTMWDDSGSWQLSRTEEFKPSRRQRRAKRRVEEMRLDRHFEQNVWAGMNDDQAWAEARGSIMSKSQMKYANRAWRKATANWGMNKKNHRSFCRENAAITVHEYCGRGENFQCQSDADYQVAEELTYWED